MRKRALPIETGNSSFWLYVDTHSALTRCWSLFRKYREHELEAGAHGGGNKVGIRDMREQCIFIGGRVDPAEVGDYHVFGVVAHLVDGIGVLFVECLNEGGGNVGENKLVASPAEDHPNESATDIPGAKVQCFHLGHLLKDGENFFLGGGAL